MLIINKHFNFCCYRGLAYTTLDRLCAVFAAQCYASAAYVVMRCLSVRVSVTFMDYVKTNKHIINFFTVG